MKVVRVNNEIENGHEKMNKVRKWLTIIPQSTSYFAIETGEGGLSMAQAGSRKRSASIGHYARLRTRQPYRHGLPWLENGHLNGYLERRQADLSLRDRFRIVRPNKVLICAATDLGMFMQAL